MPLPGLRSEQADTLQGSNRRYGQESRPFLLPNMRGRWCLVPPLVCLVFSHHTPCNASFHSLTLTCLPDAFAASHCLSLLPSAFLKVFSMFYLCDNHTSVHHTAQCNTQTHSTQPILSRLVFQRGRRIRLSLALAWGLGLIKTHYVHIEHYYFSITLCSCQARCDLMWLERTHWCCLGLHISLKVISTGPLKGRAVLVSEHKVYRDAGCSPDPVFFFLFRKLRNDLTVVHHLDYIMLHSVDVLFC